MKRWKRAIKHVVVFALLGVVMSYAVAWGAVWVGTLDGGSRSVVRAVQCSDLPQAGREDSCWESWEASRNTLSLFTVWTSGRDIVRDWDCSDASSPDGSPLSLLPHWAGLEPPRWTPESPLGDVVDIQSDWRTLIASGWPARCCWCELPWRGPSNYRLDLVQLEPGAPFPPLRKKRLELPLVPIEAVGGVRVGGCFATSGIPTLIIRALPYRPVWPGLLLNTAFYGSILWLLWFGPGMIRRGSRRRRGLCVRCGYDLRGSAAASGGGGGSVCPECGGSS